jgi:hypothetical protein
VGKSPREPLWGVSRLAPCSSEGSNYLEGSEEEGSEEGGSEEGGSEERDGEDDGDDT